jgi:hypothetical protein
MNEIFTYLIKDMAVQLTQLKYCKILTFFLCILTGAGGCN